MTSAVPIGWLTASLTSPARVSLEADAKDGREMPRANRSGVPRAEHGTSLFTFERSRSSKLFTLSFAKPPRPCLAATAVRRHRLGGCRSQLTLVRIQHLECGLRAHLG